MIAGRVTDDLEPVIGLRLIGPGGLAIAVDAVVDTGFTGFLALPPRVIGALELTPVYRVAAVLADGSTIETQVYECRALWDGEERKAKVHRMEGKPLVGMSLLLGFRVAADVIHDGPVLISELP